MEDNFTNGVIDLYKERNWKTIVEKYHDHPDRSKLLWVFPSQENFQFLKLCVKTLKCDRIVSVGCGSGLLEWMIMEATDLPVSGVEVDSAWWNCKYAPPTFIPLLFTPTTLDRDVINILDSSTTALLFCYFNNRPAFKDYMKHFFGNVLIIIGPDGKSVHTDPKPFGDVGDEWKLYRTQEVRSSKDFIAVYTRSTFTNE